MKKYRLIPFLKTVVPSGLILLGTQQLLWSNASSDVLKSQIHDAQKIYQTRIQQAKSNLNQNPNPEIRKWMRQQKGMLKAYQTQLENVQKIPNGPEREEAIKKIHIEYSDPKLYRASEIWAAIQNELQNDTNFMKDYLGKLQSISDVTIQSDAFMKDVFHSKEFQKSYGKITGQVVWSIHPEHEVAGQTVPANLKDFEKNPLQADFIIKLTPLAFQSPAILRSTLLHEINHALMFKDAVFLEVSHFLGPAIQNHPSVFSHYFGELDPKNPAYQFLLIHEYYGMSAQCLTDQEMPSDSLWKLSQEQKNFYGQSRDWLYSQMNASNQAFVKAHPEPLVIQWMRENRRRDGSR